MSYFGIPIRNGLPIGLGSVAPLASGGGSPFSPLSLFSGGAPGAWYDPSDFTTLFQDSAGTTPVTAVEQPVGRMLDKSGNGNHAFQATSASRPVLRARYNLLTKTEDLANPAWEKTSTTVTTATTATIAAGGRIAQYFNATVLQYTTRVSLSGSGTVEVKLMTAGYAGVAFQIITLSATPQVVTLIGTPPGGSTLIGLAISSTAGASITVAEPDLRVSNDGITQPVYQRVNTATDYATAGFLPYLKFDGVDDSLSTNSISFTSTDKMSVFAGVRKLSDTAYQVVSELSTNSATQNGAFSFLATSGAGPSVSNALGFGLRGSAAAAYDATSFPAPSSYVMSSQFDIGGAAIVDEIKPRINGAIPTLTSTGAANAGTGNFGNYPLFIGRRNNASLPFNGQLYSMIVVGKAVTNGELSSTETYVNQKTGAY